MNHQKQNLPSAMEQKLRSLQRRQIAFTTVRSIAMGLGMLAVGMIVAMTIDWIFVLFRSTTRTLLTFATVGVSIAGALVALIGPLRSAWDIRHAARWVDSQVPHLQQRWTTVASLSQSNASSTSREQLMRDQVSSEAVAMHPMVRPSKLAPFSMLLRPLIGLGGCVLALGAFMAIYPQQTSVLWNRFWSPNQNITATQLMNNTSHVLIPRGDQIDLAAGQQGIPRSRAELTVEYPSGRLETIDVPADTDDAWQFVHTMRVDESIRYRMRAGDGQTPWQSLEVIDYPEIGEVQFKILSPAYVHRPDVEKGFVPRRIKVIQGSTLRLAIRPLLPVQRLAVLVTTSSNPSTTTKETRKPGGQIETIDLVGDADGWYSYEQSLRRNMLLELKLWSEQGLQNEGRTTCRIEAIADAAPVARVISPSDEMAVAEDEIIDIQFEAHDDHGIAKAELIVYDDAQLDENGNPKILQTREIPLGDQTLAKHLRGETTLDLQEFMLKKGAQISYAIRVTDNRNSPVPNPGDPDPIANQRQPDQPLASNPPTVSPNQQGEVSKESMLENVAGHSVAGLMSAQNGETNRRRLKITQRLDSLAAADAETNDAKTKTDMRDRIEQIDEQLATSQSTLQTLVDHSLPDSSRGKTLNELDAQIGSVQDVITALRTETKSSEFAFVGLQMVDLSRFQITPARDRVFGAKRRPSASDRDIKIALGHVVRARDRLAKLIKRYDRVQQDRDLQKSMEESIRIYDVYVEKSQVLLREAMQNRNPLSRRMAVVDVDQDYLDRLAEVLEITT